MQVDRNKMRVRIINYLHYYDKMMDEVDSDSRLFNYSEEELLLKEFEIIKELDRLLIAGIFDNQAGC